jgi:hypothetical protein
MGGVSFVSTGQNQLRMRFNTIVRTIDTNTEASKQPGEQPNT